MVTGFSCVKTALISSSVTGPATADPDSVGTEDEPFLGTFFFEVETGSSFTGLTS